MSRFARDVEELATTGWTPAMLRGVADLIEASDPTAIAQYERVVFRCPTTPVEGLYWLACAVTSTYWE